jgi:hypothetical protein
MGLLSKLKVVFNILGSTNIEPKLSTNCDELHAADDNFILQFINEIDKSNGVLKGNKMINDSEIIYEALVEIDGDKISVASARSVEECYEIAKAAGYDQDQVEIKEFDTMKMLNKMSADSGVIKYVN